VVTSRWRPARKPASEPRGVPWARPRHELALLLLVAVACLTQLPHANPQDRSRMCLSQSLTHGRLWNDACLSAQNDYASFGGHLYSDKAPGLSLLELPTVALLHPLQASSGLDVRLWAVRLLSVGLALLACTFLVGRVAEGIAPGYGAVTLVTFALGTIAGSLAQISFEHVPAALAVFGAFLLAWAKRPLLAGLTGGLALLTEYQCGLLVALIALYLAVRGFESVVKYAVGVLPGALLLAGYDWAAFGAPWHLSYRYVSAAYRPQQGSGLFGIGLPSTTGAFAVFSGDGGLLVVSPVLALGAYGLYRLRHRFPQEMLLAATVIAVMLVINIGYYLPYGGTSPGPRYLAPAIPFLALGLAPAFAWRPRLTLALACVSIATSTAINLVWSSGDVIVRNTVWGEILRIPTSLGHSTYARALSLNIVSELGPGRWFGALVVIMAALTATVIAARAMPWTAIRASRAARPVPRNQRRRLLVAAGAVLALGAVDAAAVFGYPYGNGFQPRKTPATVTISWSPKTSYMGGDVNFTVNATNLSPTLLLPDTDVTFYLSPGMTLVGPPQVNIGSGCTGNGPIVCHLNYLAPQFTATIYFGIQFSDPGPHFLKARLTSDGFAAPAPPPYLIRVGT
jgi:hypothetical protein